MKKRHKIFTSRLLIISVFLVFANSCEKDDGLSSNNPTNGKTTAVFNPDITYGTMTDQDGNIYKTVTIGTQTWMAENLRTTKYNDGVSIPNITIADEWVSLSTGAYCNYNNTTSLDTIATYGRLYNWYAVNTGKLAPIGWHVPSEDEWVELAIYLGGVVSDKLKEKGTIHWKRDNVSATNESGFTALPGGGFGGDNTFNYIGINSLWWKPAEYINDNARISIITSGFAHGYSPKMVGLSVRCVRD